MANEWVKLPIAEAPLEIIDGDRGINYPKQDDFSKTGYCLFLNAGNVTAEGFNFSDCSFISEEKDTVLRKGKVQRDDIVLTTRGTVGNVALYDTQIPYAHMRINSGMVLFRPDKSKLSPRFLYQFVRSGIFKGRVIALITGSAQPQLPIRDIKRIEFSLPPLDVQNAIAHILGTLDDKIELNRKQNETLEAMARTMFKAWFVDFEPVHAKMEGRWRRGDSLPGLPAHLYDLFPERLTESELGEIPEGWEVTSVDVEFDVTMGQSPPGNTYNQIGEGLPFYQGRADFEFRFPKRRVYCTAPTRLAKNGDTLVSVRAPVGDINMSLEDCAIGRGVAAVRHKTKCRSYTYQFMNSISDVFARFDAEGTVFGSIGKKDFHSIAHVKPPRDLVLTYEKLAAYPDDQIERNERESRALVQLRDTLLPKLISGELRVPYAKCCILED